MCLAHNSTWSVNVSNIIKLPSQRLSCDSRNNARGMTPRGNRQRLNLCFSQIWGLSPGTLPENHTPSFIAYVSSVVCFVLLYTFLLEKEMATHSSVLAWRIPGTGEPGGLPSMGSPRVGHDWSDLAATAYFSLRQSDSALKFLEELLGLDTLFGELLKT